MTQYTLRKASDLQGAAGESLAAIVKAAGIDRFLDDGNGQVPYNEHRQAILIDDMAVVGFISPFEYTFQGRNYWRTGPMYLLPGARGRGIMLSVLTHFYASHTPGLVWIDEDNADSIKLFVAMGFTRHSAWPGRNGGRGHWYTYGVEPDDTGPHITLEEMPDYLRW